MLNREIIKSIESEYRRYKALADAAMAQLTEDELNETGSQNDNSVAIVAWHIAGNLRSRFTDFLESDGEKPWRNREEEFARNARTRLELKKQWEDGWSVLFRTLSELTDGHLEKTVYIRGTGLKVHEALHRSLAHTSYHVGQIVYIAKSLRGSEWEYLSIAPGKTEEYNSSPTSERATDHASKLKDSDTK